MQHRAESGGKVVLYARLISSPVCWREGTINNIIASRALIHISDVSYKIGAISLYLPADYTYGGTRSTVIVQPTGNTAWRDNSSEVRVDAHDERNKM